MYVTKREFARRAGVSPAQITQFTRPGKPLHPTLTSDGKIDTTHSAAKTYMAKRNAIGKGLPVEPRRASEESTFETQDDSGGGGLGDDDVDDYLSMTLDEIMTKFGTDARFKLLLDARLRIEEIKGKDFVNKAKAGEYIPRELIEKHLFPFIDNAFRRLVEDLPGTLTRQVKAKVLSENSDEEIAEFVRDAIGKTLRGLKENSIRLLKDG